MKYSLVILSFTFITAPILAQVAGGSSESLYQWHGSQNSDSHGYAVSGGGDIDRDGIPDLITSAIRTAFRTLDAVGHATAGITFPAGVFQVATGRTFWLSAVAFPSGQRPAFSSVAVPVEFIP